MTVTKDSLKRLFTGLLLLMIAVLFLMNGEGSYIVITNTVVIGTLGVFFTTKYLFKHINRFVPGGRNLFCFIQTRTGTNQPIRIPQRNSEPGNGSKTLNT
jgi:hypothetical protein